MRWPLAERTPSPSARPAGARAAAFGTVGTEVPLPVISAGADGLVAGWNDAATEMLGWSALEAIGRPMAEVLGRDVLTAPGGAAQRVHLRIACRSGRPLDADVVATTTGSWQTGSVRTVALIVPHVAQAALFGNPVEPRVHSWTEAGDVIREVGGTPICAMVEVLGLRAVNVGYSRSVGDTVLATIADRLATVAGDSGHVLRTDGERFAVIVPEAAWTAGHEQRLVDAIRRPVPTALGDVRVTASAGIAFGDATLPNLLLDRAEISLQSATRIGANSIVWMGTGERTDDRQAARISTALLEAIAEHEIHPVYQPIVEIATGEIVMLSAFIRWDSGILGVVDPGLLVSVAEDAGLIFELGHEVLCKALDVAVRSRARSSSFRAVSVKVSPRQLAHPEFVARISTALAERGLPGDALHLDVTERLLIDDPEGAAQRLGALRDLGVRIALDHFGTGRSNLAHLVTYPVDEVKADRRFVQGVRPGSAEESIVRTTLGLAGELGLDVIAEGVESDWQHAALVRLGCRYAQGNAYASARPAAQALDPVASSPWESAGSAPAVDDPARLAAVHDARAHFAGIDVRLDELARRAATVAGAPAALVVLVDEVETTCPASVGIDPALIDVTSGLWPLVLGASEPLCIDDVDQVADLVGDPMVDGPAAVRAFASIPLVTSDGHTIGALCVVDHAPRPFDACVIAGLSAVADLAAHHLDSARGDRDLRRVRREAAALQERLASEQERARRMLGAATQGFVHVDDGMRVLDASPVAVTMLDLDHAGGVALSDRVAGADRAGLDRWFYGAGGARPRAGHVVVHAAADRSSSLVISSVETADAAGGVVLVITPAAQP